MGDPHCIRVEPCDQFHSPPNPSTRTPASASVTARMNHSPERFVSPSRNRECCLLIHAACSRLPSTGLRPSGVATARSPAPTTGPEPRRTISRKPLPSWVSSPLASTSASTPAAGSDHMCTLTTPASSRYRRQGPSPRCRLSSLSPSAPCCGSPAGGWGPVFGSVARTGQAGVA